MATRKPLILLKFLLLICSGVQAEENQHLCEDLLGMRHLQSREEFSFQLERDDVYNYWRTQFFEPFLKNSEHDYIHSIELVQRLPRGAQPAMSHPTTPILENYWRLADHISAFPFTTLVHRFCMERRITCELSFLVFKYRDNLNVGSYTVHKFDFTQNIWDSPIDLQAESNAKADQQVGLIKLCLTLPQKHSALE